MPDSPPLSAHLEQAAEIAAAHGERRAMAAVVAGVCTAHGVPHPRGWDPCQPIPFTDDVTPDVLGAVRQHLLSPEARRERGAHYTPPVLADQVAELAFGALGRPAYEARVCDPAAGGGALLLAAARRMHISHRSSVAQIVGSLHGVDTDPLAVDVCRASLWLWSAIEGEATEATGVEVGDGLTALHHSAPFDVVMANPPFLGQMRQHTARTGEERTVAGHVLGSPAGHADTAAVFLKRSVDLLADGGVAAVILPESVMASAHAGAARSACLERAALQSLWVAETKAFDAQVRVCVPIIVRRPATERPVSVMAGPALHIVPAQPVPEAAVPDLASWAPLLAHASGSVELEPATKGRLGEMCEVAADFRDEYYRLVPHVTEADAAIGEAAPLVTSGAIDPAALLWGDRPVRFAKQRWEAPVVQLRSLAEEPGAAEWLAARRQPKVLLATQTAVLEAVVDGGGATVPVTPVITLVPEPALLHHVAAVLLSPVATAWARRQAQGSALSPDAIKLSAAQVREIPLPAHWAPWDHAATVMVRAHDAPPVQRAALLVEAANLMLEAYEVDPDHPAAGEWAATVERLVAR